MRRLIVLDTGPLGMVTNPKSTPLTLRAGQWLKLLLANEAMVAIPEIADYEVRRELLRVGSRHGVDSLDTFKDRLFYLPITTEAMLKAAEFWAAVRRQGKPTADAKALDADVILAAQATIVAADYDEVVVATNNPGHLSRFVKAENWEDIT